MIFGKKRLYALPKFPPNLIPTFNSLCDPIPAAEIPALKSELEEAFKRNHEESKDNTYYDAKRAGEIQNRCFFLLEIYGDHSIKEQGLIMGAIRYCAAREDTMPDEHFATGMDDDAKVLNHVLEELGIEDRYIEIS